MSAYLPARRTGPEILAAFAKARRLKIADLTGPSRLSEINATRQELMAVLKDEGRLSYPAIGRLLGDRDPTTIMHGVKAHRVRAARP